MATSVSFSRNVLDRPFRACATSASNLLRSISSDCNLVSSTQRALPGRISFSSDRTETPARCIVPILLPRLPKPSSNRVRRLDRWRGRRSPLAFSWYTRVPGSASERDTCGNVCYELLTGARSQSWIAPHWLHRISRMQGLRGMKATIYQPTLSIFAPIRLPPDPTVSACAFTSAEPPPRVVTSNTTTAP